MYTYILVSLYEERRVHKSSYISHFLSTYTQSVWEKKHKERTNKENKIESAHSWYATMFNDLRGNLIYVACCFGKQYLRNEQLVINSSLYALV